jgi:hypothetical protein
VHPVLTERRALLVCARIPIGEIGLARLHRWFASQDG